MIKFSNIKWNENQKKFISSKSRFSFYIGGYRSGKTYALCRKALKLSIDYPGNVGMLARFSYGEIKDTLLKTFLEVAPPSLITKKTTSIGTGVDIYINTKPQSLIMFRNLKNPQKYESLELGWFGISQINEMGITESIWDILESRLSKKNVMQCGFAEGNITGNCSRRGWVSKKIKLHPHKYEVIYASTYDNFDNLPQSYKEYILSMDEHKRKIFTEGSLDQEFTVEGLRVFEGFDINKHTIINPLRYDKDTLYIGIDMPGPLAAVLGYTTPDGGIIIVDSIYEDTDLSITRFAGRLIDHIKGFPYKYLRIIFDPAAFVVNQANQMSYIDLMANYFPRESMIPSPHSFFYKRSEIVKRFIAEDKLLIVYNTNNERLISAMMGGYRLMINNKGEVSKEPVKDEFSHISDALQYLCCGLEALLLIDKFKKDNIIGDDEISLYGDNIKLWK